MLTVRIPEDLRDRIDAIRPSNVSREAWIRFVLCEELIRRDEQAARPAGKES